MEVASYFARRSTRQGWIARRLLGRVEPTDPTLRDHLIAAIGGAIRPDGSVGGNALATIGAIHEMLELDADPAAYVAPLDWVLTLEGRPGTFGEGCSAARHAHRVCEHFLGGFFSPAPSTTRVAPVTFPNGKSYRVESQARFAVSCFALQVVLLTGRAPGPGVARHLDSFAHLFEEWAAPGDHLALDLAFAALGATAAAPDRWAGVADGLLEVVARQQLPDGTWQRADFFNALDAVSRCERPGAAPVLRKALPALLQRQRDDGSFGSVAQDERALIGVRVLRAVG